MSSNTSEESRTISTASTSEPSSSEAVNPVNTASLLEPIAQMLTRLTISPTGESVSNPVLMPSDPASSPMHEMPFGTPSSNLKSHAKPHEIQESLAVEPRILRVSKEDIEALCQVVQEFKEQCGGAF